MLSVFLFSLALCNSQNTLHTLNDDKHSYPSDTKRNTNSGVEWKNIRIKFDYSYIDGSKPDPMLCKEFKQKINWWASDTCLKQYLIFPDQINALKGTLENVRLYLEKFLSVIPLDSPINVKNYTESNNVWTSYEEGLTVNDVDYYAGVFLRPGAGYALATQPLEEQLDKKYHRPTQGNIIIPSESLINEIQSEDSENNSYFYYLLQKILREMGFHKNLRQFYHPYEDEKLFKETMCKLIRFDKEFKILTTPFAHKWAVKHYGVDTFYGDNGTSCPSGIELADTESDLSDRVIHGDVMTKTLFGFETVTDATVAVLQDTGNYKCNYSMTHPLVWGHPESIDGKFIEDFATGPPRKVFPSGYLNYDFTGFDYTFLNIPAYSKTIINCSFTPYIALCKNEKFYNPFNESEIAYNYSLDFINLGVMMTKRCPKGQSYFIYNNSYPFRDVPMQCGEYECNGFESLTWRHYDTASKSTYTLFECNKSNAYQGYQINYENYEYTLICPDPERFCRTMKLNNITFSNGDPFDPNYLLLGESPKTPSKPDNKALIIGICVGVLAAVIIAVISIVIYFKVRAKKAKSASNNFSSPSLE